MTTRAKNRATAILATGVFLLLSLLLANFSPPKRSDPMAQRSSTFFTDPTGTRALLLIMHRLLPAAEQWRRPLYRLPLGSLYSTSTLIVVNPITPLSTREFESLHQWLSHGGQLMLLTRNGWPLHDRRAVDDSDEPRATLLSRYAPALRWSKPANFRVEPANGSSIPAADVKLRWRHSFIEADMMRAIASAGNQTLAVEIPVGQGRIVAIADPTMASNAALRRSDNSVWLVSLVAGWGDGRALFDEYHHGFGDRRSAASLAWAFAQTPWGWCLWQLATAGLLYIFLYGRRFGRVTELPMFEHSNPLDLIDARAGLFRAADAQGLATQLMVQNLSQELTQAHGRMINVTSLNPHASKRIARHTDPESLAELKALAARAERGEKLIEKAFIRIGRLSGELSKGQKP